MRSGITAFDQGQNVVDRDRLAILVGDFNIPYHHTRGLFFGAASLLGNLLLCREACLNGVANADRLDEKLWRPQDRKGNPDPAVSNCAGPGGF